MTQPVVDYETRPIIAGSGIAPRPVGIALLDAGDPVYLRWGHPSGNNATWEQGRNALIHVWDRRPVFHNSKFDIGVALQWMNLPWPEEFDDTMILAYLADPLAMKLGLKELAR